MSTTHTTTRQIPNIEAHIQKIASDIEATYQELTRAHRDRIAGLPLKTQIWQLRDRMNKLHDEFDLAIYELNYRRI